MKKRRYPLGERKDRLTKLLDYISANPGCRRLDIQAYTDLIFESTLSRQTIPEYVRDCAVSGILKEENGQFFITESGEATLTKRKKEMQKK